MECELDSIIIDVDPFLIDLEPSIWVAFSIKIMYYRLWQVVTEFEEQWANQKVQGWDSEVQENGHIPAHLNVIDLDYYSTVEELMEVGPEKLKEVIGPL